MRTNKRASITSLPILFLSLSLGSVRAADKAAAPPPSLPVYKTEEIAAPELDTSIRKVAESSGVEIKTYLPRVPVEAGKFIGVGAELRVTGSSEQATKFLAAITQQNQFQVISSLVLSSDRKDPKIMQANLVLTSWFARTEKAASKVKKWQSTAQVSDPAIDLYASCIGLLPEKGVRFTGFDFEGKMIRLSGEASNSLEANRFGGKLFKEKDLSMYRWDWEMRPRYNIKKKDGTVEFSIYGKRSESSSKKGKRKKAQKENS